MFQAPNVGVDGKDFGGRLKVIKVKVESIKTGEIVKEFDCGTDERKADKMYDSLMDRTNTDKYYVYLSVEKYLNPAKEVSA